MRHHLRSPLVAESSKASIRSFNDAPVGLLSPHFTGRTLELAHIRSTLQCRSDDKPARCAIVGMPGLGKTQLALKYTSDIFDTLYGPLVFWISAASVERMVQGFCKVLDLINHIDRDHVDQNVKVNAAQRWLEGSDQTGLHSWLLVCDNVDEASLPFLRENLPRANNRGAIIFTMRSIDVAKALLDSGNREKQLLKLALPSQQDAVQMLVAELDSLSPEDKAEATQANLLKAETLVNELGRLPLAVNQAASFANHSYKDLDYLLGLYQSEYKIHMLRWDNVLSTHEQRSVVATFENKLSDLEVTAPVVSLLLKVMSFLDAESIPIEIWTNESSLLRFVQVQLYDQNNFELAEDPQQDEPKMSPKHSSMKRLMGRLRNKNDRQSSRPASPRGEPGAVQQIGNEYPIRWQGTHFRGSALPSQDMCIQVASASDAQPPCEPLRGPGLPELSSLLEDPIEFPKALQTIEKLALVTVLEDEKALRIHDLVQLMIRHDAKKSQSEELCHWAATSVISRSLHSIGDVRLPQSWPFYDRVLPHFNALQTTMPTITHGYNVSFVRARRVVGSYLKARCQLREAESILLENMSYVETHVGAENPDYLRSAFALAALYYKKSNFEAAEILVKKVASTRKRVLGDNHTEYVNTKALLANICRNQGRYDEAENLFKEVLEQHEKYGNALDIYCVMNDFALLYSGQGRSEEAVRICRQILNKADGEETANLDTILTVKANLGHQELLLCRNDDAQASLEWALSTREKFWGIEDPVTQELMLALKDFWRRKNGWNQAEILCVKVADLKKRLLGEDHIETLSALLDLAEVYDYQERYEEALTMLHLVIDGRKRQLGPDNRETLEAQRMLAVSHRSAGRYEEAERILESNLEILTEKFAPDHLDTLATLCTLGDLRKWQGRLDEAYLLLKRALTGQRQSLKDDNLELLHTMRSLGDVSEIQGKDDEPEELYKSAFAGYKKRLGWPVTQTVFTLGQLCIFYQNRKRYAEAEPLQRQYVEGREENDGPDHEYTLSTLAGLANTLEGQGRYEEAEPLRRRVYNTEKRTIGCASQETLPGLYACSDNLINQGRVYEAMSLQRENLQTWEDELGLWHPETVNRRLWLWQSLMDKRELYLDDEEMCKRTLQSHEERWGLKDYRTKPCFQVVVNMLYSLGKEHDDKKREMRELVLRYVDAGVVVRINPSNGLACPDYEECGNVRADWELWTPDEVDSTDRREDIGDGGVSDV